MSFVAGMRFGAFEIVSPLGAGGMGEVYRARDTRLDRHVAVKVLLDTFARDPERLARFEREAKLLASLNCVAGRRPRRYGVQRSEPPLRRGLDAGRPAAVRARRRVVGRWPRRRRREA